MCLGVNLVIHLKSFQSAIIRGLIDNMNCFGYYKVFKFHQVVRHIGNMRELFTGVGTYFQYILIDWHAFSVTCLMCDVHKIWDVLTAFIEYTHKVLLC